MLIKIELKRRDISKALRRFGDRAKPGIVRALNRGAVTARTYMARAVAKDLGLKIGDVNAAMQIKEANQQNLRAVVLSTGTQISLMKFRARGPIPSRGKGRGVTAKLPPPGKGQYPRAFIATVRRGQTNENLGVFERKGKARLPIKKLHGPSIAHVFAKYQEAGLKAGEESVVKNLKHEFEYALSQS